MFQDQQEIPGQRHLFERLKSVDNNIDAIKLAEPFPTETLLPQLVHQTLEELKSSKRCYKNPRFIGGVLVLLTLAKAFLDGSSAVDKILSGGLFISVALMTAGLVTTPAKQIRLIVAILNNRLLDRRETRYCVAVIRLLGAIGTPHGDTPTLQLWLFATLPFLTESEAQALPEEARVVLRRWLTAFSTTDAERVVLLLVLASANDEKARELARRYKNVTSEAVREAARELLA